MAAIELILVSAPIVEATPIPNTAMAITVSTIVKPAGSQVRFGLGLIGVIGSSCGAGAAACYNFHRALWVPSGRKKPACNSLSLRQFTACGTGPTWTQTGGPEKPHPPRIPCPLMRLFVAAQFGLR